MNLSPGLLVDSTQPNRHHLANPVANPVAVPAATSATATAARPWRVAVGLALLAWAASAALHAAHAGELVWSVGVQAPGAVVHVANAPPPMVVMRPPVYATSSTYVMAPPVVMVDQWGNPVRQGYIAQPAPRGQWEGRRDGWREGERGNRHHRHHDRGHHHGWDRDRW